MICPKLGIVGTGSEFVFELIEVNLGGLARAWLTGAKADSVQAGVSCP